ncbi:hypothetical protein DSO57_1001794 [Entomophthora muscae]|uniref:Uncharacterized protein n=1 Tax=Entomophthora muscae TaxID=34485 RepID=A0ACC2U7B8_9FUNG|nr:hypothetical protein DSO57_1001794 [Entomophthora muscae]
MLEKVKPVLDTSYKPYVSDGNQEEDKEPEFFRIYEGQLVLKKVAAFYTKMPMSCKPVSNQDLDLPTRAKPAQKRILDIKRIILLKLMRESGDYKVAAALVGVDPKYASKTFNKFINTVSGMTIWMLLNLKIRIRVKLWTKPFADRQTHRLGTQ